VNGKTLEHKTSGLHRIFAKPQIVYFKNTVGFFVKAYYKNELHDMKKESNE
jgi:hypothetical protein